MAATSGNHLRKGIELGYEYFTVAECTRRPSQTRLGVIQPLKRLTQDQELVHHPVVSSDPVNAKRNLIASNAFNFNDELNN